MKKLPLILATSLLAVVSCSGSLEKDSDVVISIPVKELSFGPEASTQPAYVVCEGGEAVITMKSDQSWCSVVEESSTSTKTRHYSVSVDANTSNSDRTAIINVSASGFAGSISVKQSGSDYLHSDVGTLPAISSEGGTVEIKVSANIAYEVSVSAEWLTETTTKANVSDHVHEFTASKNIGKEREAVVTFSGGDISFGVSVSQKAADMGNITATATDIASLMYPGWNLGNTMEATASAGLAAETSWQGTRTTQSLMDFVARCGFRSVRIPCSWDFHSDASGTIDAAWIQRVREVVDYCISAGLYVVLNDHWDNGWIEVLGFSSSSEKYVAVTEEQIQSKIVRLKDIWTQIASYFKDYGDHLLFAGLNEPAQEYNLFSTKHETITPILHRYNQAFVEAVRATGGNNASRTLVVQGPSTNIASTYNYFSIPEDVVDDRLMVEVHYYDPWNFCSGGDAYYYGSDNHLSGSSHNCTYGEDEYLKQEFKKMRDKFTSKGIPVIIGEYAADRQVLKAPESQTKHDASIALFYETANKVATDYGIVTFAWDTNNPTTTGSTGTIIKRKDCTVFNSLALDAIMKGIKEGSWPY